MRWIGLFLVLVLSTVADGSTRYLSGIGIPTTSTLGGELISGTVDWGTPEDLNGLEYDLTIGDDNFSGEMSLTATTGAGPAFQLIYGDAETGLVMTAVSADGPVSLDPADFVDTEDYGGFEFWSITQTSPEINRYGSVTRISATPVPVPEPELLMLLGIGVGLLALRKNN